MASSSFEDGSLIRLLCAKLSRVLDGQGEERPISWHCSGKRVGPTQGSWRRDPHRRGHYRVGNCHGSQRWTTTIDSKCKGPRDSFDVSNRDPRGRDHPLVAMKWPRSPTMQEHGGAGLLRRKQQGSTLAGPPPAARKWPRAPAMHDQKPVTLHRPKSPRKQSEKSAIPR